MNSDEVFSPSCPGWLESVLVAITVVIVGLSAAILAPAPLGAQSLDGRWASMTQERISLR